MSRTGFEGLDNEKKRRRWSRTGCEGLNGKKREGDGAEQAVRGWMARKEKEMEQKWL